MSIKANEYHLVAFDPGGTIGWGHLVLDCKAFSRPEHKALRYLKDWSCGEFSGGENEQVAEASRLIWRAKYGDMPYNANTQVISTSMHAEFISEGFELTQMIGGDNLLSPVRINAKLEWECYRWGLRLQFQSRSMRTNVTPERLQLAGFDSPFRRNGTWSKSGRGKDAFAAMQHAVTWVKRVKDKSMSNPWKLSDGQTDNAYWDCACKRGRRCDLTHRRD